MPSAVNRRLLAFSLAIAMIALLAAAPSAFADLLTPDSGGSPNANDIDSLYKIAFAIGVLIFALVQGVLIYTLVKYRARRNGPEAQQIRGNTPLEIGWTLGAALILVVLTVVTFVYLDDIKNPPPSDPGGLANATEFATVDQPPPPKSGGQTLNVKVDGLQYLWRYRYPGEEKLFAYFEMVVPTKTTVTLDITSSDVIHSWWIPKLGGKMDGVPGHVNQTWFKIDKPGVYTGVCAELCGSGHADMRARVRAVEPSQFQAWARRQRAAIKQAQEGLAEQRRQRERSGQVQ